MLSINMPNLLKTEVCKIVYIFKDNNFLHMLLMAIIILIVVDIFMHVLIIRNENAIKRSFTIPASCNIYEKDNLNNKLYDEYMWNQPD